MPSQITIELPELIAGITGFGILLSGLGYGIAQVRKGKLTADLDVIEIAREQLALLRSTVENQQATITESQQKIADLEARYTHSEMQVEEYRSRVQTLEAEVGYLRELIGNALRAAPAEGTAAPSSHIR